MTRILRLTPEQHAEYERKRVSQIGNVEFVDAVGGPSCKASVGTLTPVVRDVLHVPAPKESQVLRAGLAAMRIHPDVAWCARINAGRFEVDGRWITASFKGCSDVIGQHIDGRFIAAECKSDAGKTTADQQAFLDTVARNGGIAFVARSAEDVWRALGNGAA